MKEQIKILAVTSDDKDIKNTIDGYPFIPKDAIFQLEFDYALVAMADMSKIHEDCMHYTIPKEKLIPIRVTSIPYFDFDKYINLKKSKLTIFSSNCWGGGYYHYFGMEFLSPTINMFFDLKDFNKFMFNLDFYLSLPVEYVEMGYARLLQRHYPIGIIGDIKLYFNHYTSFENANECWERRKKRINKNNILVVSYTISKEIAEEFDCLPYKNKIIFTSFDNNIKSAFRLNLDSEGRLWDPVNKTANGVGNLIDMLAFLNHEQNYLRTF